MGRPKKTNPLAAGGGAALGALLGGPLGAILGAGLGAVVGEEIPSLEEALREAMQARGMEFVSVRSTSPRAVAILFRQAGMYRTINVEAPAAATSVDDSIYDGVISYLDRQRGANAGHP